MQLSFNSAAQQSVVGSAAKIRVAVRDGVLRIRPTARKAGVNLPKGEKLIDLNRGKAALPEGFDLPTGKFALRLDKYGWHAAIPGAQGRGSQVTITQ